MNHGNTNRGDFIQKNQYLDSKDKLLRKIRDITEGGHKTRAIQLSYTQLIHPVVLTLSLPL